MAAVLSFDVASGLRALQIIRHAYEPRVTIPILSYVMIAPVKNGARLKMTNLDMEISTKLETGWEGPKKPFLIPFRALNSFLRASERGDIARLEYDAARKQCTLSAGGLSLTKRSLSAVEDFPIFTEISQPIEVDVSEKDLHRHFSMIRHCISTEETRYYLNGICFLRHPQKPKLRTIATDGRRMGVCDSDADWPENASGIIPREFVAALTTCLRADGNDVVRAKVSPQEVGAPRLDAAIGDTIIKGKLIDGTFPDYTRVLPDHGSPNRINLTRLGIMRPMSIAREFAKERSYAVRFDAAAKSANIRISSDEADIKFPIEAQEVSTGEGVIGFNGKFLEDQARVTPVFQVGFKGGGDPAEIRCEDPNVLYVLMPMRV